MRFRTALWLWRNTEKCPSTMKILHTGSLPQSTAYWGFFFKDSLKHKSELRSEVAAVIKRIYESELRAKIWNGPSYNCCISKHSNKINSNKVHWYWNTYFNQSLRVRTTNITGLYGHSLFVNFYRRWGALWACNSIMFSLTRYFLYSGYWEGLWLATSCLALHHDLKAFLFIPKVHLNKDMCNGTHSRPWFVQFSFYFSSMERGIMLTELQQHVN